MSINSQIKKLKIKTQLKSSQRCLMTKYLKKNIISVTQLNKEISQGIYRIEARNSALIIIDIQEKLMKAIPKKNELIKNIEKIKRALELLETKIYFTEQNPLKLGSTINSMNRHIKTYEKMSFSCYYINDLKEELKSQKIKNVILCGVETHVCILQSAIDMIAAGFNIHIPVNAIGSRFEIDHKTAIDRFKSYNISLTTMETLIFEICKTADNDNFRAISNIIKE